MKSLMTVLFGMFISANVMFAEVHPSLLLTKDGVREIKQNKERGSLFEKSYNNLIKTANNSLNESINIPIPKDGGGGYTHEVHKNNYYTMYYCGLAYQLTGNKDYSAKVKNMLLDYSKMYTHLGLHPIKLSSVPGHLFWQTLNESVWLVHTTIAYDCIYETLTEKERNIIENKLIRPAALFIMGGTNGNLKVFNKMHNHGTWAVTAVGMAGMVMNDNDLIQRALYGYDKTGEHGGFIQQLDCLFSPDGYYTEGAYYQRYSIWPFMLFAQCIQNRMPQLNIFKYRNSILIKSIKALLQLSYNGDFLKYNDALYKNIDCQELIQSIDIAYNVAPENKDLLDIVKRYQKEVMISDAGYHVSVDCEKNNIQQFYTKSEILSDGKDGNEGGFVLIRSTDPKLNSLITVKATSHGMSHGHYDKMTFAYYDNNNEIFSDYGAARWLNIEAKYEGHYTPENDQFAKQTIAHNTLVVDGTSDYDGNIKKASEFHANINYFDCSNIKQQIVSVSDTTAYKGVKMMRTIAYITTDFLQYPLIIDVVKATSLKPHKYELSYWYNGQPISFTFPMKRYTSAMDTYGDRNGYQFLWKEAQGENKEKNYSGYTFMKFDRCYSITTSTSPSTKFFMLRLGANDPNYNLRNDATAYVLCEENKKNQTFASSIETHGFYDLSHEQSDNMVSLCTNMEIIYDNDYYTIIKANYNDKSIIMSICNKDFSKNKEHTVVTNTNESIKWYGAWSIMYGMQ